MDLEPVIGIDLGGTNIIGILINKKGDILARKRKKTLAQEGKNKVITQIIGCIKDLLKEGETLGISSEKLLGIGVGSPGPLNRREGIIYSAPNLPGWENVPLVKILRNELGISVFLENDANAAALAEWWLGAGKNVNNLILLTLGTGIGGGIIIEGEVYHGARDMGAELGHIVIKEGGLICGCGTRGCLEAYASATGVVKRARAAMKKGYKTILKDLLKDNPGGLTCELVFQAAQEKDPLAVWLVEETGRYLAIGIGSMVNVLNPEMVILSGGMIKAGDLLFNPVCRFVRLFSLKAVIEGVRIVSGNLGDEAGAIGAAATVLKERKTNFCRKMVA